MYKLAEGYTSLSLGGKPVEISSEGVVKLDKSPQADELVKMGILIEVDEGPEEITEEVPEEAPEEAPKKKKTSKKK